MTTNRSIIVGDVHGCVHELESLLEQLKPVAGDHIHFIGDLVDRGPDSAGVIRRVRKILQHFPGSVCIAGNHEDKLLRNRARGKALPDWSQELSADDWAFLARLPLVHRLPEHAAIMVHGGFFPAFFAAYGELGEVPEDWRTAGGKRADRMRRFLRIRQVNQAGNMVSLFQATAADPHWSDVYDGREGFAFYGHDAVIDPPQPVLSQHAMNLDTGCCFGGSLTAAILYPGQAAAAAETVSVPARKAYAKYLDSMSDE